MGRRVHGRCMEGAWKVHGSYLSLPSFSSLCAPPSPSCGRYSSPPHTFIPAGSPLTMLGKC